MSGVICGRKIASRVNGLKVIRPAMVRFGDGGTDKKTGGGPAGVKIFIGGEQDGHA